MITNQKRAEVRAQSLNKNLTDRFQNKQIPKEPTRCIRCNALYINGKWNWDWNQSPPQTHIGICPACKRIEKNDPAGIIILSGPVFKHYRTEIMNMIYNIVLVERRNDPLQRIMGITTRDGITTITTTDKALVERISGWLQKVYEGEHEISDEEETFIRIKWYSSVYS